MISHKEMLDITATEAVEAIASSQQRVVSCDRCATCNHWEPKTYQGQGPARQVANIGYCPVFQKDTTPEHGSRCTAYEAANAKSSDASDAFAATLG